LQNYLEVKPEQISEVLRRYLDTDNRVLLEIVPSPEEAAPAAPHPPGEAKQPTAPLPQVPPAPDEPTKSGPIPATQASESALETT
jgi:hypothetical protein